MDIIFILVSCLLLLIAFGSTAYLYRLAFASVRSGSIRPRAIPSHRFAIAIPAHNEDAVIADTVARLRQLDYPAHLFDVHIVADHCTDNTVAFARTAGAVVHDRFDGPRDGKGGALRWLFMRILPQTSEKTQTTPCTAPYTAVIIFDADTRVAPDFLRIMDARLAAGDKVVQGQHRISNPEDGMFPKLTYAMFLIDNRFQNQGRTNLGLSAKIMGDSICFDADVLRKLGWGEGLTEDYQLRLRLLMEGICVVYEPAAVGKGEAAQDWVQARAQRARWLTGTRDASSKLSKPLLREALRTRHPAMLDGALQTLLPSFSTLMLVCLGALPLQLIVNTIARFGWQSLVFPAPLVWAWAAVTLLLIIYPLFGLYLERTPLSALPDILSAGMYYVFWRTVLAVKSRLSRTPPTWIRTQHGFGRRDAL